MQIWSGQNAGGTSSPTRKFITTILITFSLAGLIIGFAVGGLTHYQPSTTNTTNTTKTPPITAKITATTSPKATPTPEVVLGFPQFNPYPAVTESATNSTPYKLNIQAVDKQNKPIRSSEVVCKLWLVQHIPGKQKLLIDTKTLKDVDGLTNPIMGTLNNQPVPELTTYLTFTTPQTTHCDANGKGTWEYTIAPTAAPGDYELVVLCDWKGVHYNYSWANITIA